MGLEEETDPGTPLGWSAVYVVDWALAWRARTSRTARVVNRIVVRGSTMVLHVTGICLLGSDSKIHVNPAVTGTWHIRHQQR
jgi:hypothetical protein